MWFLIFFLIYIFSIIAIASVYAKKCICPGLWSLLFLFTPILNTVFAIKLCNVQDIMDSYKKFIEEIKEE